MYKHDTVCMRTQYDPTLAISHSLTRIHAHTHAHTVTLRPAQGAALTLRGFLIQGRTQITNDMVGTFADPAPLNTFTQLSMCTPRNVGVTHNNPGPAENRTDEPGPLSFTWTAPAAGTGPIWFRYTIMQDVATWWADDSSAIVQEGK
jgi:hypothetical protein